MSKRKKTSRKSPKQTPATLREKTRKNLNSFEKEEASAKQKKRTFAYLLGGAGIILILGLVFSGILISRALAKPVIGFRDVHPTVQEALLSLTQEQTKKTGKKWKVLTIDPALPLKAQQKLFKKTDLLITTAGAAATRLGENASIPPQSLFTLMPTAIRTAGFDGTNQFALPILLDHFELAWNIKLFQKAGGREPKTLQDLTEAGKKVQTKSLWPMLCAGGNDETLLSFVGALCESILGETGWKEIQAAASSANPSELIQQSNLVQVLEFLTTWRKEGFLHPEWFRMNKTDIESFMENEQAFFVAMSLMDHRQVQQRVIERFNSTFFPTLSFGTSRSVTAPAILALTPEKRRVHEQALLLRNSLVRPETQAILSARSDLAPTGSQAQAPDKQANDVRFWASASSTPLPSFSTALYADPKDTNALAKAIRTYLESN